MKFLKVPVGLYKKANSRGLLSQLLFYFEIKKRSDDGRIPFLLPYSDSWTWKQIKKLKELGWIDEQEKIISYNRLFEFFDYDLSPYLGRGGKWRLGNFKILKVLVVDDVELQHLLICYAEIFNNILTQKQAKMVQKLMGKLSKNIFERETLSTKGIARILGFLSKSSGYKILKKLEKIGLIQVFRNVNEINLLYCQVGLKDLFLFENRRGNFNRALESRNTPSTLNLI